MPVYLYSDASSHRPEAYPDPLVASGGRTIQWFPVGRLNIVNWSLTLLPGACNETTINRSQPVCTVKADASKSRSYSITADACTGTGSAGHPQIGSAASCRGASTLITYRT
jgi:hypothetical protein